MALSPAIFVGDFLTLKRNKYRKENLNLSYTIYIFSILVMMKEER